MKEAIYPSDPILIVDDDPSMLKYIAMLMESNGLNNNLLCADSRQVCSLLARQPVVAILLDLFMPYLSGEELLPQIRRDFPQIPTIVVTGTEKVETAVRCIKLGAFDYVIKPGDLGRLPNVVKNALAIHKLHVENETLRNSLLSPALVNAPVFADIITNSGKMLALFRYAELIADSDEPVLITGETGVGKELLVKAIHNLSKRPGPLMTVNIAGLDDNMFSDTLFGHAKGAFTGADQGRSGLVEQASDGTLFLDEIGDLSTTSQAKLLRLLQNGDYLPLGQDQFKQSSARIISATNHNLWALAQQNSFRKDLNFRLRTHHIHIPPLRERKEDLPLLIEYFLDQAAKNLKRDPPHIPDQLLEMLKDYPFPGNIRELRSMMFNALSTTQDETLSLQSLRDHLTQSQDYCVPADDSRPAENQTFTFSGELPTLKKATSMLIEEALHRTNGNQALAGQILGISQQAVSKRLRNLKREWQQSSSLSAKKS